MSVPLSNSDVNLLRDLAELRRRVELLESLESSGGSGYDYIHIADVKSSGTSGGSFNSGAWRVRDLNTELSDEMFRATLSGNQITLQGGNYIACISAPAFATNRHRARLYNVTDSAVLLFGTSEYAAIVGIASTGAMSSSLIVGRFTLDDTKVLEVQHMCEVTASLQGFGVETGFGDSEIYTVVELFREH